MEEALDTKQSPAEQDRRISEAFEREQPRLRSFIRRRVADSRDAEDILQEVFTELVEAYRMFQTIDQAGANLLTDPLGDVLMVSAAVTWTGRTAALVITDAVTLGVIGGETGGILGTEDGGELGLES